MKYSSKEVFHIIGLGLLLIAALLFLFWPVETPSPPDPPPVVEQPEPDIDLKAVGEVVSGINRFAFDLYQRYREGEANVFFSPYSVATALAMTYEGAAGRTAEEMRQVFGFPDGEVRRPGFLGLIGILNRSGDYELSTANALWPEEDFSFLEEYFQTVRSYYRGQAQPLDFRNDPEGSRLTINRWVEAETRDKIKDLIPEGFIGPLTRLVLTNAIYFRGEWSEQFDPGLTREDDFRRLDGSLVRVPMMRRIEDKFGYAEVDGVQALSLPYQGEELDMLVLLPEDGRMEEWEAELDIAKIDLYRSQLTEQRVDLFLPRFKMETKYFMKDDLAEMGMPSAFGDGADFSGITGSPDLFISSVIHQAFVEVNEEGTEAAAATGVIMIETALMDVPAFRADRPFFFLIQHRETGAILFMGRVGDPA